ncbi:WD40-repeat-containing domain protein [Mycotypha africana]|uniref:WD40-repeat-containing domain protein n=1 Tax=Mycotypha africana TaxID=64632 RepID=UPI0023018288|nr:WD40-repeat-containing domain protein [Mycotypha africana]KAI8992128.1 WD40-repeat-containing domain protein [Mycotypha africana]
MNSINKDDVVKLIIQFLRESNLNRTRSALEKESNQIYNTVEDKSRFIQDIKDGKWDIVLKQVTQLAISEEKLIDLYEQIVFELIENNELSAAEIVLRKSNVLRFVNEEYPERYEIMERYLDEAKTKLPHKPKYTSEERRTRIAKNLEKEIAAAPNSRLLSLLGQSIKWQQLQGSITADSIYDLFRGTVTVQKAEQDIFASKPYVSVKFPAPSAKQRTYAECAAFSKNGLYLATGSSDGFIEIWNYLTGKLRKDLSYQAQDRMMAMDKAVLCVAFSRDNELLASGSADGKIFIWKVKTGQCQRKIIAAHATGAGVTSLCFSKENSQILSGSYDQTIKIHGLKSGKMLKEFRGHSSFVNAAVFSVDNTRVLSASSDGTVKIWDCKTTSCLNTITPQPAMEKGQLLPMGGLGTAAVQSITPLPRNSHQYLICNKTNTLYVMDTRGQIVRTLTHKKPVGSDFLTATLSPQGDIVYAVTEDNYLYGFQLHTGETIASIKIGDNEVVGLTSHPLTNVVVAHDDAGYMIFFKAP